MSRWRLPLRLARRDVWRRPGRSALVALLVALPVAAMAMAVVLIRTDRSVTRFEEWERSFGQADAIAWSAPVMGPAIGEPLDPTLDPVPPAGSATTVETVPGSSGESAPVQALIPERSRVVRVASLWQRVRTTDGQRAELEVRDLPLDDPITAGIFDLVAGRTPRERGEVVLSRRAADELRVEVGDGLALDRPEVTLRVVGLVEPVGCLSCTNALVAPGEIDVFPDSVAQGTSPLHLIDLPAGMSEQEQAALGQRSGGVLEVRAYRTSVPYAAEHDGAEPVRWSLVVGAVVLTVMGIVISAAFAVGARRQLVTIGQLSASGVAPSTVRAALALEGTVTGAVGVVVGLAIAGLLLGTGEGVVERVVDERIDGYVVRPGDLVAVALLGLAAATIAAFLPARTAARIPTLAALAGRRPLAAVSRRLIGWGFAAFVAGLGLLGLAVIGAQSGQDGQLWAYVAILGGVAELLGACAIAPAVVARLEPLASRLRGSWRLGARSLARHRARTGAVVSAVAAAGALAVAAAALIQGAQQDEGVDGGPPPNQVVARATQFDERTGVSRSSPPDDDVRAELAAVLPNATEHEIHATVATRPVVEGMPSWWQIQLPAQHGGFADASEHALVADATVLGLLDAGGDIRGALDDVGIVVLAHVDGAATVALPDGRVFEAVATPSRHRLAYSSVLISPERADELGLSTGMFAAVFETDGPLSREQRYDLEDLAYVLNGSPSGPFTDLSWSSPRSGPTPFQVELLLAAGALAFSLFVVGVSLALAAAESKDERDVLTIAGAPPGALARSAGARAWLLAGIGGAMAVPIGFLPVVVFSRASGRNATIDDGFPLVFPGRTVLLLLVVVPTVVAVVAWAASATAQRARPVRVSTSTFE